MTNIVSFPGLGIGEIKLNEVAFSVFGKDIAWYGVIITFGMICGFFFAYLHSKYEKISLDDLLDYAIYIIIFGIIGARAYYVVMRLDYYTDFKSMIAIWNGGLAIYGGIIGGTLAAIVVSKIKKIKIMKFLDLGGPACMIGQAIGRWGNFVNAEAYGEETSLPWRMGIVQVGNTVNNPVIYVHPTFLYESLWNLIGFVLINLMYKNKKFDGQMFLFYISWYGFGRMLIEGLRTDSLMIGNFRVSQLLAAASFAIGVTLLIVFTIKSGKKINDKADISSATEEVNG